MAQSVGIKDVARAAGVSVGTVSNVINRPDSVASETRARVQSAIDRLGYVRSESARQLRAGRSRIMGLLVLDMGNPFFVDVARGAERAARDAGLGVMVCNSAQSASEEADYLSLFAEQRVRGVLLTPADATGRNIATFRRNGIPFVLVDRVAEGTTECSVSVDDVAGGALAVRHLVDAGHRSIAYVSGPPGLNQVRDRRVGALNALAEAGLAPTAMRELPTQRLDVAAGRDAGARRPAGHVRGGRRRPRRPRDRRLRRHRVRRRGGRPAHLRTAARHDHGRSRRRTAAGGDGGRDGTHTARTPARGAPAGAGRAPLQPVGALTRGTVRAPGLLSDHSVRLS